MSNIDRPFLLLTVVLIAVGLLMVASASMVVSDQMYHYPLHFFLHQLLFVAMGTGLALLLLRIELQNIEKIGQLLLLISLILLIVVLIPGVGRVVNGSRRWLNLVVMTLQVSEIVKLFVILFLASFLVRRSREVSESIVGLIKPLLLLGLLAILLLLEPDFGAVAVIICTALLLLFLAGARLWPFALLVLLVAGALGLIAVAAPYRLARLTAFLHPWANQFSSGYQLTQSLIAFGRGGLMGVGFGNSLQKLFYLPEAHTDFVFAVLTEEFGLIGAVAILVLLSLWVWRVFHIALRAKAAQQYFSYYAGCGIAIWIALQTFINIGVNIGLLPTKGLTLPFLSYGGSSLLVCCVASGIVLRMSLEIPSTTVTRKRAHHLTW